jgi:Transmembrane family 220, helix
MAFRIVDALMALILLAAVAVQYNDPDPIRWMAIYGAACLLSVITVVQRHVHPAVRLLVSAVALVWSAAIMLGGPGGACTCF